MQQFKLKSFDNAEIFVTLWDDVKAPCGVVQLLHGMSEYAGRYEEFARYLNSRGYIVFADDHRGHGRTETDENRGRHKGDIFKLTLQDELYFRKWLQDKYDLPIFLIGHSYGSFLCQAIAQCGTDVKAIVLLGSGYMRGLFNLGKVAIAPLALAARNWRPNTGKNLNWVNSLPERIEQIHADPMASVSMSMGFCFSMMSNASRLYSRRALGKLNPATSIGIFSGEDDAVGRKGKGVKKLHKMYEANGVNCELHLYKGSRHDVIYDRSGAQVQEDIADFLDKFIIYEQTSIDDMLENQNEEA